MSKEQKFYKAIRDVFIGAKIEGESGFVNLMRIKSNYYSQIEKKLERNIEEKVKNYPNFKEELFDKLYSFFSRYFTDSGSVYFNSTPFHNNIYEKVYTDEKDVILFWKTQMLYYVKTDKIFKSVPVEFDGLKFYFDASEVEHKKSNEKRTLIYELKVGEPEKRRAGETENRRNDRTIVFKVLYSERGRKTKMDEILKKLKKKKIQISEDQLQRAFKIFQKQSEVDYFINKNAKEFLKEQFKLWLYQYFFEGSEDWSKERIDQLQILKNIAYKIIDFISQFEDELVKIWNKPKFVKNSNYVITLDRFVANCHCEELSDEAISMVLIEKIIKHKNFNQQVQEWQQLGIVDENFKSKDIFENDIIKGKRLNNKYSHLPADTKYFKDLELEILCLFDNLDKELDGWLIKSENYQALNTILPKFKERIQTIYIDPPFNLEVNAEYHYNVKYKDSSWITILENRINLAKDLLNDKGGFFTRCDYNGNMYVRLLMNNIFGNDNFRNEIVVGKTSGKKKTGLCLSYTKDYILFYSKTDDNIINSLEKNTSSFEFYNNTIKILSKNSLKNIEEVKNIIKENLFWLDLDHRPGERKNKKSRILLGVKFEPPKGRHWIKSQEKLNYLFEKGKARIKCKNCNNTFYSKKDINPNCCKNKKWIIQIFLKKEILSDNWTDISGYSQSHNFPTENSEQLLKRVIMTNSTNDTPDNENIILDFFLGSGTTTAVAHKLGRKWLGIEMGEHFHTVVLPRMKKVLAGDKTGISKEVNWRGGGFFKYYEFEQYEEALKNTKYEDGDLFLIPDKEPYSQYVFMKDKKMLDALKLNYTKNKVKVNFPTLYKNIDIPETLSNLLGKNIKKIKADPSSPLRAGSVEFEDGEKINIKDLDYKIIKPLIWW